MPLEFPRRRSTLRTHLSKPWAQKLLPALLVARGVSGRWIANTPRQQQLSYPSDLTVKSRPTVARYGHVCGLRDRRSGRDWPLCDRRDAAE
jgi:hypothetical protein